MFTDALNLPSKAKVRLYGADIGEVTSVEAVDFTAKVSMRIRRDVPVPVLTAVVDGEVTFASLGDAAVGRGAVTTAPDGTVWLGISAVHVAPEQRRRGHARTVCEALLGWGAQRGATRAYVQVLEENTGAIALYRGLGFVLHHHHRYVDALSLAGRTL